MASGGPKLDEKTLIPLPPGLKYEEAFQIDYAADILDIYQTFIVCAINLSHSLYIICPNRASLSLHRCGTYKHGFAAFIRLFSQLATYLNASREIVWWNFQGTTGTMLQGAPWPSSLLETQRPPIVPNPCLSIDLWSTLFPSLALLLKTASFYKNGLSLASAMVLVKQCLKAFGGPWL